MKINKCASYWWWLGNLVASFLETVLYENIKVISKIM